MVEIADVTDMHYRYEASFDCGRPVCDDLEHFIDWIPHGGLLMGVLFLHTVASNFSRDALAEVDKPSSTGMISHFMSVWYLVKPNRSVK